MKIIVYTKRWWCLLCLLLLNGTAYTQDSSHLRISLLTCSPGDDLYAIFGHSALRITDSSSATCQFIEQNLGYRSLLINNRCDLVFNYGTFDFNEKGFYVKFMRGKLLYYLSIENFSDFAFAYQSEHRSITEQVLNLSGAEKLELRNTLIENLREEKKHYLYDFFLDNCTTRLRDMIVDFKHPRPVLPAVMPVTTTFRQAIHHYLDKGNKQWSKLGIDILLGARTDGIMTPAQQQFLPDNLMFALDSSNVPVVESSANLYPISPVKDNASFFSPINLFGVIFLFYMLIALGKNRWPLLIDSLDRLLFFLTGLTGVILLLMWFGTDHRMTKNNFNILWLWPINIIFIFFIHNKTRAVRNYLLLHGLVLCLFLLSWSFLPQKLNPGIIPLVLLLIYRSFILYFNKRSN
jgi:hypothetical protein